MIGEIVIVRHPVHACVPVDHPVVLSVRAEGSGLKYQWFTFVQKDGERRTCEVPGGTQADLTIQATKTQNYSCRVNDHHLNCSFSEWAQVTVLDTGTSGLPLQWCGEPHIAVNPRPQTVRPGARLTLRCTAFGIPPPAYQWYRNGQELKDKTHSTLQIRHASAEDTGTYLCSVTNVLGEGWTQPAEVHLLQPEASIQEPTLIASDKVALLIGNLNYSHHPSLTAPIMDVQELAKLLRTLDFRVVSLLDLTRDQMIAAIDKFIQLLDRGVYGLFYYAGHGFEYAGRNYLVSIDAPQPYQPENCVRVQTIMRKMQEKNTALNLILLDTCRKWYRQASPPSVIQPLRPCGNTVYGYATGEDAEAFEVQDRGKSTGIFTKYLNKYILLPERVTHVLEKVSEDVGRDVLVRGKQAVEIRHTLTEPRSLTDPLHSTGHTTELRARDACWRHANELPQRQCLRLECGAEVQLSFSALFSNVLVLFGSLRNTGPHMDNCTLTLTSTPAMEDIFSGPGRSEELDSLLFDQANNQDCTLRLCGLQTLQESLVIKVDLHYTHTDSGLRLTESRVLNIGRPLVASWELRPKTVSVKNHGSQAQSTGHIPRAQRDRAHPAGIAPGRPSTRKAECVALTALRTSKEPEENDENDMNNYHLQ